MHKQSWQQPRQSRAKQLLQQHDQVWRNRCFSLTSCTPPAFHRALSLRKTIFRRCRHHGHPCQATFFHCGFEVCTCWLVICVSVKRGMICVRRRIVNWWVRKTSIIFESQGQRNKKSHSDATWPSCAWLNSNKDSNQSHLLFVLMWQRKRLLNPVTNVEVFLTLGVLAFTNHNEQRIQNAVAS